MRFSPALLLLPTLLACKGTPSDPTPPVVDCVNDERTSTVSQVQVPDWPAGLGDAIDIYRELDGRWSAEACGTPITVSIRTSQVIDTAMQIVTTPLEAGNLCGCTHDPVNPIDGDLEIIARTTLDFSVQDYPEEGFSESNAGNVSNMPVAIYGGASGMVLRACSLELVPPALLLEYRDTEVTFRADGSGPSATINLIGPNVEDASCNITNWVRTGDN